MTNMNRDTNRTQNLGDTAKLNKKIKETWSKMEDDDIQLYDRNREQFFNKLKEKQNVSREDGEKRMLEIEKSCGCGTAKAA